MDTLPEYSSAEYPRDADLSASLRGFSGLQLAMLFGSFAAGKARFASDIDVGVLFDHPLSADERLGIVDALASATGRPIDLIDLHDPAEPLLGEIIRNGRRLLGSDEIYARLIARHLFDEADFMPYQRRILAERRASWIG